MPSAQEIIRRAALEWEQLVEQRPDLASAVSLQRRLVTRSLELGQAVAADLPVDISFRPAELADRLRNGIPMLAGEWLDVTGRILREFAIGFCLDLEAGERGGPAGRLGQMLAQDKIDVGSLVAASIGRQQQAIRAKAHHVGVAPDLLWLVAELTSAPIANRLQRTLTVEIPATHPELQSLICEWNHGFCCVCGSWPALAEHADRAESVRSLRCSFCGVGWSPVRRDCIYCQKGRDSLVTAAIDPNRPARRIELCRLCSGYLKCLDVQSPTPFELLAVADLGTTDLDIGAAERGYARPSMRAFISTSGLPCPPASM